MSNFKLLIIEDDQKEVDENYKPTIARIEKQLELKIDYDIASTLEEAIDKLGSSFDGAIVDLKLDNSGEEKGNDVIREIHSKYRIAVAVFTGTPNELEVGLNNFVKVFTRDEGLDAALGYLLDIYSTGLTKIMGGRGQIESAMSKIFWDNIIPHIGTWVEQAKDSQTESGLLRYVVNHVQELLENESHAFPQEMYVAPPMTAELRTGSILKHKNGSGFSVVLSPPCDLAIRQNGQCKTDRVLVCGIEDFDKVKDEALLGISNASKRQKRLEKILKNNETDYYHWLPKTSVFQGGLVNFRWVNALPPAQIEADFEEHHVQVAAPFIKDLLARFSSYYARQGQPDFNIEKLSIELS